jgi:hypothetical protein
MVEDLEEGNCPSACAVGGEVEDLVFDTVSIRG